MRFVRNGWTWLADVPHHTRGVRILQSAIGLMLLFRVFTEGPFALYLWGPSGLGSGSTRSIAGPVSTEILDLMFTTPIVTYGVLLALAAGAIGLILGRFTRAATALALLAFWLLELRLPELPDGGDNITRLVLIYMLFLTPAGTRPARGSLSVWLHNVAVLAIALQIIVLYTTSGLMKAYGEKWHDGIAMYYISQVEWFSLPSVRDIFKDPVITTLATYFPMFHQLWFPMAMTSRLKLPWLALGIMFHLGIAMFMGLVTFSTVMIGLELFLISDPEYHRIQEGVKMLSRRLVIFRRTKASAAPALRLFIDGFCPNCRTAGHFIKRLDLGDRIEIISFRHNNCYHQHGILQSDLEHRMHLVDLKSGTVLAGFDAVRALVGQIGWLWPIRPVLTLAALSGQGNRVYDALASQRRIIPDPQMCKGVRDGKHEDLLTGDNTRGQECT